MSFHTDLVSFLRSNSTIEGAAPGGIYHEFYPQGQSIWPVLVIQLFANREIALDQDYPTGDQMNERRYQFDLWGETSEEVVTAAETIDSVMRSFSGTMGSFSIQRVERDGQRDLSDLDGDKIRRHLSTDYVFTY